MEFKDYYKIMGLTATASQEEIKKAYRKLARKYHPDVSKEAQAEAKFKEVGEAYEVLKDPEKRSRYDALKQQGWRPGDDFTAPPNGQERGQRVHINPEDMGDFSDFFESMFGYQARDHGARHYQQRPSRGEDVYYILEIDPEDSYHGVSRHIEIPITQVRGAHLVQTSKKINVKIPKGVINQQQIRLKGQGSPGIQHGPPGDLYLEIKLNTKDPFHIEGRDVTLVLPITPWEAALGAKIKVPTLGGPIEVKVPSNAQAGAKLRLKGRGLPGMDSAGDQYVVLQIVLPPTTDEAVKALYQQIAEQTSFNPRQGLGV